MSRGGSGVEFSIKMSNMQSTSPGASISISYRPPWIELPPDITANILHRLGAVVILNTAQKVCRTWRSVCKDPAIWRVIDMRNHGGLVDREDLVNMCRHAVDRSHGQLVDINLDFLATPELIDHIAESLVERSEGQLVAVKLNLIASDELLDYIAGRLRKLKSLELGSVHYLTDAGLIEAVKRLPLLEKLVVDVVFAPICSEALENVGRSCPLLKSFGFNTNDARYVENRHNEDAMAIARSMPGLRHLELMGNGLTNEGLEAILNGCPHLESLDLRRCNHVELYGDIGKRLSEQIKCVKYPK